MDLRHTSASASVDDGSGSATGAKDGDRLTSERAASRMFKAQHEPVAVGVVAHDRAVIIREVVHGAEPLRRLRELIAGTHDRFFVRHGDRQSSDP